MGCGGSKKEAGGVKAGSKPGGAASIQKDNVKEGGIKHAGFIIDNPGKITEFYDIDKKKLGEGSYGAVSKCSNKATGVTRAVKSISKSQMKNLDRFKQEIAIMKIMDHPNIIKLYESFEDHRNIYLVLELCTGGELFDRILEEAERHGVEGQAFDERGAANYMQQILGAMRYLHDNCFVHRDIKPENFLLQNRTRESPIKVIDFGLAKKFDKTKDPPMKTKAGTPYYVAPQVLMGSYDEKCDIWSCGVIAYILLCGYPPFYGDKDEDILRRVRRGDFEFPSPDWDEISAPGKDIIEKMLTMVPEDRPTAGEILEHRWLREHADKPTGGIAKNLGDKLRVFRGVSKLKKVALTLIAQQLNEKDIEELKQTFQILDKNRDGTLTAQEIKEGMRQHKVSLPEDLEESLRLIDTDGSGVIDYTEFLAATLDKKVYMAEDVCWQAFRIFDRNGDGKIDKAEIANVLNDSDVQSTAAKDLAEIMKDIDTNGDGEIDFQEFMQMMRGSGVGN
mmetsp:Transcript_62083/g.114371  ORF Transcript_62083/g.114371 Transcript_62083/m.114371 type:complete len:505 (-) Transcript_62083:82-1596(-)